MKKISRRPGTPGHPVSRGIVCASSAGACAVLLLSACSSGSPAPAASSGGTAVKGPGGTVTIRSIDDIDTFNPATTSAPNMAVEANLLAYDRLVYLNPAGQAEPYLATSWTTTPDSVTFTIRKGATCDNGTPVTPTVIASSLRYSTAPSTHGPYVGYIIGQGQAKSITADTAADTVTVTLTKPYNGLVTSLATAFAAPIICPAGVANPKSLNAAPDGSGPYVYDQSRSVRGSMYVFTLRKNYDWGPNGWTAKNPGVPTTIIDRVVTDETTAANLMITGGVDIAPVFGVNEARMAADRSAYTYTTSSLEEGSWGAVFNQNPGLPGADLKVREAAYLALNGPLMLKAAFAGQSVPFTTLDTPNMQCYDPGIGGSTAPYDPSKAKAVLEQDGYRPGSNGIMTKDGKPLTLRISMWNTTGQLGDYMQQELGSVGIASTVQITDIGTWLTALFTTKKYDLTVYSYYSSFPNPVIFPAQDATLSVNDATYFAMSATAEAAPSSAQCPLWSKALTRGETNYDVKPIGVEKNVWFARGWKFEAPTDVDVDPFTLVKTG